GAVGYVYQEVGCDTGAGNRVGCFRSAVVSAGPQLGFIIPLTSEVQGYLNLKSYWEFGNHDRPAGWNGWVTFAVAPAEQTPSAASRRMRSMKPLPRHEWASGGVRSAPAALVGG